MTTFALDLAAIQSIATLRNAVDPNTKALTPILQHVHLHVTAERWTATATDRYIVAELSAPMGVYVHTLPDDGITILVRPADLADAARLIKADGSARWAMFTVADRLATMPDNGMPGYMPHLTVTAAHGQDLETYRLHDGNFPPVGRLFPDPDRDRGDVNVIAMRPSLLARLGKVWTPRELGLKAYDRDALPFHFHFTPANDHGKPGNVLITRPDHADVHKLHTFRALIQPNLILD